MTGTTAQLVALTCHGNAFLRGLPIAQFFPANSTCQFCDRVTFVELTKTLFGKQKEVSIAETPDLWFGFLKRIGCRGLKLSIPHATTLVFLTGWQPPLWVVAAHGAWKQFLEMGEAEFGFLAGKFGIKTLLNAAFGELLTGVSPSQKLHLPMLRD